MKRYNLLLADDTTSSLKLLKALYETENYMVYTAGDGLEALKILLSTPIDLVITDVLMPNMDGYYLCYKIRTHDRLKNLPIIIYTSTYTSASEEDIARQMGADLFIKKPAPMQVMIDAAKAMLENFSPRNPVKHSDYTTSEHLHKYSSHLINKLEQRNAELEETRENLQTILNRFKDAQKIAKLGDWEYNYETKVITWSEELFDLLGYDSFIHEASFESFIERVHPDDYEHVKKLAWGSFENHSNYTVFHKVLLPDGEIKSLHTTGNHEFDTIGNAVRYYGVCLDISEIKEKEEKLKRANKELETFIYRSSHDLRGPLSSILGLTNLAVQEFESHNRLEYIQSIDALANKLDGILIQLMNIMTMRNKDLEMAEVDMAVIIESTLNALKFHEGFNAIDFQIDNQLSSLFLTDHTAIQRILFNLIENSILYRNKAEESYIKILIYQDAKKHICFEIKDNGTGIAEKLKNRVFEMFFRGSYLSTGSGLGLYMVDNLVKKLRGSISFESEENVGTQFLIKF